MATWTRNHPSLRPHAIATALGVLLVALLLVWPSTAVAKSYGVSSVVVHAQLNSDGSMDVAEDRTFTFDGDYSFVYWDIPADISNVSVSLGAGAEFTPLVEASPGTEANDTFTVENLGGQTRVTVRHKASSADVTYRLACSYPTAISAWSDVSELYWQALGDGWEIPIGAVDIYIAPPVDSALTKADVRAWAHGPLTGVVTIEDSGTVHLSVDGVPAYTYVEARVLYPNSAFPGVTPSATAGEQSILNEEAGWANDANEIREQAKRDVALAWTAAWAGVGLAVALLGVTVWLFIRHGREYRVRADLQEKYWREDPRPDLAPAMVGAIWRMGRVVPGDVVATLMQMCDDGIFKIGEVRTERRKLFGGIEEEREYRFTLVTERESDISALERPLVDLLLNAGSGRAGGTSDGFTFDDIETFAKAHPERYTNALNGWMSRVGAQAEADNLIEASSKVMRVLAILMGVVVAAITVGIFFLAGSTGEMLIAVLGAPTVLVGIAIGILAALMPRRSVEGAELYQRYRGIYNYLRDFSRLSEAPPTSVIIWNRYLVLATVFGIADEVAAQLKVALPQVVGDPMFAPTYIWMYGGMGHAGQPPAALFSTSLATASQVAHSQMASAAGGGGGFSVGGGGGFGGGGGGAG